MINSALLKKRGVQKACSLMDRALVRLTRGCGSEAFSGNPCSSSDFQITNQNRKVKTFATPAFNPRRNNKKENPSFSSMDRARLTVDNIYNNNLYLNVSGLSV